MKLVIGTSWSDRRGRKDIKYLISAYCLLPTAYCVCLANATGCDVFRQTNPAGTTSSASPAAGAPGTGTSASPTPTTPAQSFTLSLSVPQGSQNQQTRFFDFASRTVSDSGDFRFIQPPAGAPLQISTVGSASQSSVVDLGLTTLDTPNASPAGGSTTMQVADGHVYAVLLGTDRIYGKIKVAPQVSGTVTFEYRFPIQR